MINSRMRINTMAYCGIFRLAFVGFLMMALGSSGLAQDEGSQGTLTQSTPPEKFEFRSETFAAPFRLKEGEALLNMGARQMYPSPAMFDVDNDGEVELIVGDIFGSLFVYENESDSLHGDPAWGKPSRLKSADGKDIKVSNW